MSIRVVKKNSSYIINLVDLFKHGHSFNINGSLITYEANRNVSSCSVDTIPSIVKISNNRIQYYLDKDGNRLSVTDYNKYISDFVSEIELFDSRGDTEKKIDAYSRMENFKKELTLMSEELEMCSTMEIQVSDYVESIPFIVQDRDFSGNFFSGLGYYSEASHCISFLEKLLQEDGFIMNKNLNSGYHYYDFSNNVRDSSVSFTFPGNFNVRFHVVGKRTNTVDDLIVLKKVNEQKWMADYKRWKASYGVSINGMEATEFLKDIQNVHSKIVRLSARSKKDSDAQREAINIIKNIMNKLEAVKGDD